MDFTYDDLLSIRQTVTTVFGDSTSQQDAFWMVLKLLNDFRPGAKPGISLQEEVLNEFAPLPADLDFLKKPRDPVPSAPEAADPPQPVENRPAGDAVKTGTWTAEEEALLIRLRGQGMTYNEIAQQLGRRVGAVNAKYIKLVEAGSAASAPPPNRWTEEAEGDLLRAAADGQTLEQIAQGLGRSVASVKAKLRYIKERHPDKLQAAAPVPPSPPVSPSAPDAERESGAVRLPRPLPDPAWPIEDDFDLVKMHQSGVGMADVAINLERSRQDCVDRYKALIESLPYGDFVERQELLVKALGFHVRQAREGVR